MENIAVQGNSFFKIENDYLRLPGSMPKVPRLWYKSEIVEKDADDKVSIIYDLSGNGDNLVQEAQIKKPTWIDNQLNGYPNIYFNALNVEAMVIELATAIFQPYTIFAVFGNPIRLTGSRFFYDTIPSGAFRHYTIVDTDINSVDGLIWNVGTNSAKYNIAFPFSPISFAFRANGGSSAVYVNNNVHLDSVNLGSQRFPGMTMATRFSATMPTHIDFYEFILFDKALTEYEIININIDLMLKYAL